MLDLKLTQADYDQFIADATAQVNETKKVLDDPLAQPNAVQQKKAFCTRLNLYQHIADISQANLALETAPIMLRIANHYLTEQRHSLIQSGMTEQAFCANSE